MMWAPLGATQVRSGWTPATARARAFSGSGASRDSSSAANCAGGVALARAGRAVEQVGVRGAVAEGGAEDGGGVRVGLEDAHGG